MERRFASIWFRHLSTDRMAIRQPELREVPFVMATPVHGRMVVSAANILAESQGVSAGMVVADAKAFLPGLEVIDDQPAWTVKLLRSLGLWCIRYTPVVAIDPPDGLLLDISGCTHLWKGERAYLTDIVTRLRNRGYDVRMAIAPTVGTAWAVARFGKKGPIVEGGGEREALMHLPPSALRLESTVQERMHKLGMRTVGSFMGMPRAALRRRFGDQLLLRLRQALGQEDEYLLPLKPVPPYTERLPSLEPIRTAPGIEIALRQLLETLCERLSGEGKGLRTAILKCCRIDGRTVQIGIGTSRATASVSHIFNLFALKIPQIEPALGIELFILEAPRVEDTDPVQEALWEAAPGLDRPELAELLDRLTGKDTGCTVQRYLPDAHHWPERSIRPAVSLSEKAPIPWTHDRPRPTRLLASPEPIDVTAPIPDYPPMLFRYRGEVHSIKKAEGPERIEREWWVDSGEHRDYYYVEDHKGQRYWIFRSGHYGDDRTRQWFLHGFFA